MQAEFVFSGLCAFHNLHNQHPNLLEPSVILVRTDDDRAGSESNSLGSDSSPFFSRRVAVAAASKRTGPKPKRVEDVPERQTDVHIPHLSFNSATARVNEEAMPLFRDAGEELRAPGFFYMQLNGVEIELANNAPGKLDVTKTYEDQVAKRDFYWPDSKGQWNHDYIPQRGEQPKRSAVVGLMRFGSGTIDATKLSPRKWRFERNGSGPLVRQFADEVTYTVPHAGQDVVVVRLRDIESRELLQELRFSPVDPQSAKVTLLIGNNDPDDIDDNLFRLKAPDLADGNDFKFLNRIVSADGPGPIPQVVRDRPSRDEDDPVAGVSTGPCGPIGTNG